MVLMTSYTHIHAQAINAAEPNASKHKIFYEILDEEEMFEDDETSKVKGEVSTAPSIQGAWFGQLLMRSHTYTLQEVPPSFGFYERCFLQRAGKLPKGTWTR